MKNFNKNFENGFLCLVVTTMLGMAMIFNHDINELKSKEPETVTVVETEYVEVEKECGECSLDDVVLKEDISNYDTASRGYYVEEEPVEYIPEEPVVEEPIVEEIVEEPYIQAINYNFDILTPSNFTSEDLSKALDSSSHSGILHLADTFVEAEETYGINSLYLMSTIGWESGWGKYRSNTNNLAGWKDPSTGGFRYFNSEYECIMTVAEEVANLWTSKVGSSLGAITSRYCPEGGYTESIMGIMQERQNKILY